MYKTTVTEIGELLEAFKEESLLILLGQKQHQN